MSNEQYPELEKLKAVSDKSQDIGEFIDWLQTEKGIFFGTWEGDNVKVVRASTESLLADYFGIDLKKVESEKNQIFQQLKNKNA